MKKNIFITTLAIIILFPLVSMAGSIKDYCRKNAKAMNRSISSCVKAEKKAESWLAVNPVPDDIYKNCKIGTGESRRLLKDCVLRESYLRNARAVSPLNIGNSKAWYAASLKGLFPSLIRVCGYERAIDDFAVLPRDITKFHFSTTIQYHDILPVLKVKGRVDIGPLGRAGNKKGSKHYDLYIDAFLVSNTGRVIDISSTEATARLSSRGGTARFSFNIGSGYYFDKGGSVLVVASGSPIKTDYPEASCLLLGAKKITFGK